MSEHNTDFAIIGMACRFPGAENYHQYWDNLIQGKNCITEIPRGRWDWQEYYGDPSTDVNKTNIKWGGFIEDIDKFDPLFFNISPKEADCIDPQHRIFLQTAWHSLEDAGYSVASLAGKKIGIYAGVSKNDYSELMREAGQEIAPFISTGTVHSILANRLSFLFDFHGRSEAIDTACSSSLVALHNAMRDISNGECESALVGGVNALLSPTMFISHSKSGMLSIDGQCKTFDSGANGYVRGEGVGVLFIKLLANALAAGDHIHAVIKSSAVNHGGRANFLTSPTVEAQAEVISSALRKANIDPATISYIEAHGTGTPLGDPIEINALKKAFKSTRNKFQQTLQADTAYCALSSVKTNIGHLESASGIAGIIKTVLAMQNRQIPGLRNFQKLNEYIDIGQSPFYLADRNIQWDSRCYDDGEKVPRRAGVSSFGMGGVNAHIVLEEAPAITTSSMPVHGNTEQLILISSRKKDGLKDQLLNLRRYISTLNENPDDACPRLEDIAYTLQTGRDQFNERIALVVDGKMDLIGKLTAFLEGNGQNSAVFTGTVSNKKGEKPKLIKANTEMALDFLAEQWSKGAQLDWAEYYGESSNPLRVPLPGYAFVKKRCWFGAATNPTGKIGSEKTALVSGRDNGLKKEKNGCSQTLHPKDFFIQDHVVQGEKLLPGVAYLELARAAHEAVFDGRKINTIENTYWVSPIIVGDEDIHIDIKFSSQQTSHSEQQSFSEFQVQLNNSLHCKGEFGCSDFSHTEFSPLDITAIKQQCPGEIQQQDLYRLFVPNGLNYGPTFQAVQTCYYSERAIFAELKLPQMIAGSINDFVLHPSIMDGVFQTIVALSLLGPNRLARQYVPFYLERVDIIRSIPEQCYAYATVRNINKGYGDEIKFDAVICDEKGEQLVKINGLTKRAIDLQSRRTNQRIKDDPLPNNGASLEKTGIYYRSIWQEQPLPEKGDTLDQLIVFANHDDVLANKALESVKGPIFIVTPGDRFRILGKNRIEINPGNREDYLKLVQYLKDEVEQIKNVLYLWNFNDDQFAGIDSTDNGVIALLRLIQAVISKRAYKKLSLLYGYCTAAKQQVPFHALSAGFARTLAYENPNLRITGIGFDSNQTGRIIGIALKELATEQPCKLRELRYMQGKRLERRIVNFSEPVPAGEAGPIREKGVYLITGGAGGLGYIFARHFSEKYHATVLLIGRSALNPQIEQKINAVQSYGGRCAYYSADITNADKLNKVIATIKQAYQRIDGVIHAAGIIEDAYILLKKEDSFRRVIDTKVQGLLNLDAATRGEKLSFFVMFSSIAALMPNQGQSDYAAANSFLDSYAEYRNQLEAQKQRSGVSLAINWPLWAEGGMRVTAEEEAHLLAEFGMKPLQEALGIAIFEQGLKLAECYSQTQGLSQIVAIDGEQEKIARCLGIDQKNHSRLRESTPAVIHHQGGVMDLISLHRIEADVKKQLSKLFDIATDNIDGDLKMRDLGLDSNNMVAMTGRINDLYGTELKPIVFFELDSVDQLAQYVHEQCLALKGDSAPRHNTSLIDVERSNPLARQFQRRFRTSEFYLRDHVVEGQFNMPGACYIEMARQAGDLAFGDGAIAKLTNNYWARQLSSPGEDFSAFITLSEKSFGLEYEVVSYGNDHKKVIHAVGSMVLKKPHDSNATDSHYFDLKAVRSRCVAAQQPDEVYRQIIGEGLLVGPTFMPMEEIWLAQNEALATLQLPESIQETLDDYVFHPTMLTGVFQTALISNRFNDTQQNAHFIPMGIDEVEIFAPLGERCFVYAKSRKSNADLKKFDLQVCREDGLVVFSLKGFAIRALKIANKKTSQSNVNRLLTTEHDTSDSLVQVAQQFIKRLLGEHIGLSVDEIEPDEDFETYGINSVMIVELNKSFEDVFGPLSKTLFFEYRNTLELAEYFVENHAEKLQQIGGSNIETKEQQQNAGAVIQQPAEMMETKIGSKTLDTAVQVYIKQLLSIHVGMTIDEIDSDESFEAYGINSVMIVELNKAFEDDFGSLSKTLFFEYRNVQELAEYFIENHAEKLTELLAVGNHAVSLGDIEKSAAVGNEKQEVDNVSLQTEQSGTEAFSNPARSQYDNEDIAIIGVDGRYPSAENIDEFWTVLKSGKDCVGEIPDSHFDYRPLFDDDPERNKIYSKHGAFIKDVDKFDPTFFNISPREAELIDPQERLFLQVAWRTMEDAGYTRKTLLENSDRQVGVFVGALWQPYQSIGTEETLKGNLIAPSGLLYSIANRVSYFMNFSGPSLAIDSACSSSLTAVHIACRSLISGECKLAIAGGVNLSLHSSKYLFLSQNHFLSTDGRCRSFGDGGDGYVPGEGVGAILLKPLSEAVKDGDHIYAVIKGSSINHGGKTNGYTVPCPKAQGSMIEQVHEKSGINPRTISYIEAHGTGTPLGDPIEITGLQKAFEKSTKDKQFCAIGSVKSNIGHLEAAAGIASITKVILQIKHKQLVPSLHADTLNNNIDFEKTPFIVQRELSQWRQPVLTVNGKEESFPLRAGISSFGAGGSNAHIVLEEFSPTHTETLNAHADETALIVLSAKNVERLRETVANLLHYLEREQLNGSLHDLAYTLQVGREAMNERLGIAVGSITALQQKLKAYLNRDNKIADLHQGNSESRKEWMTLFADDDMATVIQQWVGKAKYDKLLELWVKGFNIDWNIFYRTNKPQRISVPGYPFAKERYWIPIERKKTSEPITAVQLHPLLHQNTSSLTQQRFSSLFSGDEFFLDDHWVGNDKVLPAVAYTEMFRAAASLSSDEFEPVKLYNLTWLKPFKMKQNSGKVTVEVSPEDNEINLRAVRQENGETVVYAQGQCLYLNKLNEGAENVPESRIKIDEIEQTLSSLVETDRIYKLFHNKGLNLQQGFQGIQRIKWDEQQALGYVSLPSSVTGLQRQAYHIHPSLLDSALQTALYVLESGHRKDGALFLPFSIGAVEIFSRLPDDLYSLVQPCDNKSMSDSEHAVRRFNVTLLDSDGNMVLKVNNIAFRETSLSEGTIRNLAVEEGNEQINYAFPTWVESPIESRNSNVLDGTGIVLVTNNEVLLDRFSKDLALIKGNLPLLEVVLLDGEVTEQSCDIIYLNKHDEQDYLRLADLLDHAKIELSHLVYLWDSSLQDETANLPEQTEQVLASLFHTEKLLLQAGRKITQVFVNLCYPQTLQWVLEGAVSGFWRSIKAEYPETINTVVSVEMQAIAGFPWTQNIINELLNGEQDETAWIRYRMEDASRRKWELQPYQQIAKCQYSLRGLSTIKQNGAYLISGGMGAIGRILAEHLVSHYHAGLILLGRSQLTDEGATYLDELSKSAANISYLQVDISDLDTLEYELAKARARYGAIDGVIHCAGIVEDSLLPFKQYDSWRRVMQPKLHGLFNLDQATRTEPLDFFMVFSSLTAVLGNSGQCDYGAANGFMDAYMAYREALVRKKSRKGLSLSVNWPLWQAGGMGQDADVAELLDDSFGSPLAGVEGVDCFEKALQGGKNHIAIVKSSEKVEKTVATKHNLQPMVSSGQAQSKKADDDLLSRLSTDTSVIVNELGNFKAGQLSAQSDFMALGFESVDMARLANGLNKKYSLKLSPAMFFEHTNLEKLNAYLLEEHSQTIAAYYKNKTQANDINRSINSRIIKSPFPEGEGRDEGKSCVRTFGTINTNDKKVDKVVLSASEGHNAPQGFASTFLGDIRRLIAELGKFKLEQVTPESDFISLGLDSVFLAKLSSRLNKKYSIKTGPAIFFEYTTAEKVQAHLLDEFYSSIALHYHSNRSTDISRQKSNAASTISPPTTRKRFQSARKPSKDATPKHQSTEDIAIIGMDCLFPGAPDLQSFWQMLEQGESAVTEIPPSRWDWRDYYGDPNLERNKTNIKWGCFVDDLDKFDASFFNISPREAALMDPQQRILLQSVWKAIEHAGYAPMALSKQFKVGFFVGTSANDYYELLMNSDVEAYSATGGVHSIAANRVSYVFDFKGPSIAVDTACSSSLVALDMAAEALRQGRCDVAVTGGVNALISPNLFISFSKAGMLSPDGNISPLDKKANGYVRGEGTGILVLKQIDKALADRDEIHAVIKGTSVNHGGKVSSLTVPSPQAQAALIVDACDKAKIDVASLNFVEMHGTGTPLGDPIEVNGLKKAFKQGKESHGKDYCGLASVKGNIGHLEAAAGVAGVIKTVLALKHKTLPAQCHFQELNPHIQLEDSPFYVLRNTQHWRQLADKQGNALPRRAGVSSFGFGGANSHVVIEEYDGNIDKSAFELSANSIDEKSCLFVLSAKTAESLKAVAAAQLAYLDSQESATVGLDQIAYTLQVGRSAMEYRLSLEAKNRAELRRKLSAFVDNDQQIDGLYSGKVDNDKAVMVDRRISGGRFDGLLSAWVKGEEFDWNQLYREERPQRVALPGYRFVKERHWINAAGTRKPELTSSVYEPDSESVVPGVGKQFNNENPISIQPEKKGISYAQMSSSLLRAEATHYLKNLASSVLQLPADRINSSLSLEQYGMDSILVMQVINTLNQYFPAINSSLLLEYRTIDALVGYLIEYQRDELIQLLRINSYKDDENQRSLPADIDSELLDLKPLSMLEQTTKADAESLQTINEMAFAVSSSKVSFKDALRMIKHGRV